MSSFHVHKKYEQTHKILPFTSPFPCKNVTRFPDLLGNMSVIDRDYCYNEYAFIIKDFDVWKMPFKTIKSYSETSPGPVHGKCISVIKEESFLWPSVTQELRSLVLSGKWSKDLSVNLS